MSLTVNLPDRAELTNQREAIAREVSPRYRVVRYIASGGFASVWEAVDTVDQSPVAIKRLHSKSGRTGDFFRELRVMFALSHPHVVRIVNFLETESARLLILELCTGGALRHSLNRARWAGKKCPVTRVNEVIQQLASGLAVAHKQGLTHRDLKPENVLFAEHSPEFFGGRSSVKLADFGLSSLIAPENISALRGITGSPAYMAPEQFTAQFGPASDIYSLGVMAFELLTGELPFHGTPEELAYHHLRKEPVLDHPEVTGIWAEVLGPMLAKNPAERPSAESLLRRLYAEELPEPPATLPPRIVQRPPSISVTIDLPKPCQQVLEWPRAECRSEFVAVSKDGFFLLGDGSREPRFIATGPLDEVFPTLQGLLLKCGRAVLRWQDDHLRTLGDWPEKLQGVELAMSNTSCVLAYGFQGESLVAWDVATGREVWQRAVPRGGLPAGLAVLREGLAVLDFAAGPGVRFLNPQGEDVSRVALPGICRLLSAWPEAGGCFARLLTGDGFQLYRVLPTGLKRLKDSQGISTAVAGSRGPLLAYAASGKILAWHPVSGRSAMSLGLPEDAAVRSLATLGEQIAVLWSHLGGHRVSVFAPASVALG
jgi:serine/threonine protein kinase